MKRITFASLLMAAAVFGQENYTQWTKYKDVTINTAGITVGAVTNFPVLVRLTPANSDVFSQAATGGTDIRFSIGGTTALKYERDRWDAANQLAEFWVSVPTIAANGTTTIRMHWGKSVTAAPDSTKPQSVFDSAFGFRGVWHLGKGRGAPAAVQDSDATLHGNHLNWIRANSAESSKVVRGVIGLADSLPNDLPGTTSNFLSRSTNASFVSNSTNGITLAAWVKRTGPGGGTNTNPVSSDEGIAMRFRFTAGTGTVNGRLWGLEYTPNVKPTGNTTNAGPGDFNTHGNGYSFHYATDGTATTDNERFLCSGVLSSGNWDHLVAAVDGSVQSLWANGVLVARRANETTTHLDIGNTGVALQTAFTLGKLDSADNTYNQSFNGVIDEVSFSRTVRDSNWIKLSYATQKPAVTALTLGATQGTALAPSSPSAVTGVAGNGSVAVSWIEPGATGGGAITGYTVTSTPGNFTCTTTGVQTCTVNGLTNGVGYTFVATATNSAGTSAASAASATVTPSAVVGVPGAPATVTGVAGNSQVTVSWVAGTTGNSATTSYTVTSNPDGKTCTWTTGALNCIVTALTNGQAYTFTVTATNTQGTSVASAASASVTPVGAPGAPTGVGGVSASKQVVLSWTAPSSNGGSAITSYKAITMEDTTKSCVTANGTTVTCTVTGLTNGSVYTFRVRAINATGGGVLSVATAPLTPLGVPSVPTMVTAVGAGSGQITVTWAAPDSNGGAAITGYTVLMVEDTNKRCTTNGALMCTVEGIPSNSATYTFQVRATNSVGNSAKSIASVGTSGIFGASAYKGFAARMIGSTLRVSLPGTGAARVSILFPNGRTFWTRVVGANVSEVTWNGTSQLGETMSAGTYLAWIVFNDSKGKPVSHVVRFAYHP